jgi:hypothetical protein
MPLVRTLLALAILAHPLPSAAQAAALPAELAAQIGALRAEKAARSPAQRKIASRLLHATRMRRGLPIATGVDRLRTGVEVDVDGATLIDVDADPTEPVVAALEARGAIVVSLVPALGALRARVPIDEIEALAELAEVRRIRPADRAITHALDVSEGDVTHRADAARASFLLDGSGIAVGVLSDGVAALASLQASGDLPPGVTVLAGQDGSGSEGTAMLEIVHDLAPAASLLFATAFNGQAGFAANIMALHAAGADVIVDDVAYFAEGVFQDDDVAAAVDAVVAGGALYFSAAGNEGNLDDGTSGVWEGDFAASGSTIGGDAAHDFGGGVFGNEITQDSPYVYTLQWSDPLAASGNDYDLYLTNHSGRAIIAASTDFQNGNEDPVELISSSGVNDAGRKLIVTRASGAGRFLYLSAIRGQLAIATAGQTSGHSAARGAVSVAAVDARGAGGTGGVFDGSEPVQSYSSDGPRRVFYEADGTPITPGNFSATGGELRQKPDLAAADCVSTATPGFAVFCGTSAAAPHAAAVAALLLQLRGPGVPPAEIRGALAATALDIEAVGVDRDSGAGIADALAAAEALARTECEDGVDNDGDGLADFDPELGDPGCDAADDASERSSTLPCDNALDDDGDGLADYASAVGAGDPGCRAPTWTREDPECQNGVEDDGDGFVDFDGGASQGLPPEQQTAPDPQCVDHPWRNSERNDGCGLGAELAFALAFAHRRARRRAGARRADGADGRPLETLPALPLRQQLT